MTRHDLFLCRSASVYISTISQELPKQVVNVSVFTPSAVDPRVLAHAGAKYKCKLFCKRDC